MEVTELVKLAAGTSTGLVIAIMVLRFMFRVVDVDSIVIQKNYTKNVEISDSVENIAKTIDKVSESQLKIVTLIDSVDRRINGYNKK